MTGNAIVGQSGGPTAAINASLAGVLKTAADVGVSTVYGMVHGIQGLLNGKVVNLSKKITTGLDLELLKRTPSSYLGSCRYKLPDWREAEEVYQKIFLQLKALDIRYFFYIGGNDSMDTICKLSAYGKKIGSLIRFIGIPKTIDNDLAMTDHTPGYGSAAKYIATAVKEVVRDCYVYYMESVTILEIMGRNAGWLAGAAALAKGEDCEGADLVYLPESAFDLEQFLSRVRVLLKEKKTVVVAVSEGIRLADGRYVCELKQGLGDADAFGHKILTGAAQFLAQEITEKIGCKTRYIEFNTPQRAAAHLLAGADCEEAFLAGAQGVKSALKGETGRMVVLERLSQDPYLCGLSTCEISQIANLEKKVPAEWILPDGSNVTEEFLRYARPLIQGEVAPYMVDGLPRHLRLEE